MRPNPRSSLAQLLFLAESFGDPSTMMIENSPRNEQSFIPKKEKKKDRKLKCKGDGNKKMTRKKKKKLRRMKKASSKK